MLLAVVVIDIAMAVIGVARCPAFFSQNGARTFVLEPVLALLVYAGALFLLRKTCHLFFRGAILFGVITGIIEVINVGLENGIPLALRGPFIPIGFMLTIFTLWGIAAFRITRALKSARAGTIVAVSSAGICMLIAVTAGFIVQFFVSPPEPTLVSSWAEFKRSGWTDARAFAVANTLESAFTHLVIAPVIALFWGGLGSLLAQLRLSRAAPASR